jgi:hypothetical protein
MDQRSPFEYDKIRDMGILAYSHEVIKDRPETVRVASYGRATMAI